MKKIFMLILFLGFSFIFIENANALEYGRVTNNTGVTLRAGPGTNYSAMGSLKYNDSVYILNSSVLKGTTGCSAGWYKIDYNGSTRYICKSYASTFNVTVKIKSTSSINMRNGAGTNYSIYTKVANNKTLTLATTKTVTGKGCSKGWYKVNYNGSTKYICKNYTDTYISGANAIVTNLTGANIRSSSSNTSSKIAFLKYGQAVTLSETTKYKGVGCSAGYYKIYYKGYTRYVCSSLLKRATTNYIVNNLTGLNIRSEASNKSSIIKLLSYFSPVVLESTSKVSGPGCTSGYYKINVNNKTGYVCSSYVSSSNNTTTITTNGTNVRNGAGTNNAKYKTFNKDQKIILSSTTTYKGDGCSAGWYKINLNTGVKYICSSYTQFGKTNNTTSSSTSSKSITKHTTKYGYYNTINKWTYRINEDYAYARSSASSSASIVNTLYLGTELEYISSSSKTDSLCKDGWYKVKYFTNKTGYVCKTYVDKYSEITKTNTSYCNTLTKAGFPASYCPYLSYLHSKHSNWIFTPEKTGDSFLNAVNSETGKNYTQISNSNYLKSTAIAEAGGWRVANDAYVAFMIDPRNYLNEKNIFAFETLNYNSSINNTKIVKNIFNGTWLDTDTYSGYFVNAGKAQKVSPGVLAARAKQEGMTDKSYAAVSGNVTTRWNHSTGYICSVYTNKATSVGTISSTGTVNIRAGAGTGYNKTYATSNGEEFILADSKVYTGTGCSAGWRKLKINNKYGYVCKTYLKTTNKYSKGTVVSDGKVNVRSGPSTGYGITTTTDNKETFTILSSHTKKSSGCSNNIWYKITLDGHSLMNVYNFYNIGAYGDNPVIRGLATAAGYVDDYDNTPWNTYKKAIENGASFVANGYIHKGQDTLFYQKFDVDPNTTYYNRYSHQYMTNILAPASEGLSSYRAYKNAGLLNQAFNFKIPVYNSMPNDITSHPVVK